jgi:hypothetical protein
LRCDAELVTLAMMQAIVGFACGCIWSARCTACPSPSHGIFTPGSEAHSRLCDKLGPILVLN